MGLFTKLLTARAVMKTTRTLSRRKGMGDLPPNRRGSPTVTLSLWNRLRRALGQPGGKWKRH